MAKKKDAEPGMVVSKTEYQAPKRIRITEGTEIVHNDEPYSGGDEVTLEGPAADAMVMNGYAELVEEN